MKRVLIYFPERQLAPKGGPAGYLYNLKNGLDMVNHDGLEISFYSNIPVGLEENHALRSHVPKRLMEIRRAYKYANYLKRSLPVDESLFSYDAIHFHKTEDMYLNRNILKQYSGKVILTSHTPCVSYQEIISRLNPKDYRIVKNKVDRLVEMDRYAFKRADYIFFPCEEAEEPYYNTWKEYASIREASKYRYIPTGIVACSSKISRKDFRKKYNIPENAFVISYAGRHNEIKGYADLKKMGEKLLEDRSIYFLIAGKEGPMYGFEDEHWIEVGWTSDPHSLITASDVFILPNHETYFDLILLEVLSLGIPIVMSETGGNKYFKRFEGKGLLFYTNLSEAKNKILELKAEDVVIRKRNGNILKSLFEKKFTVEKFAENYIKQLKTIF